LNQLIATLDSVFSFGAVAAPAPPLPGTGCSPRPPATPLAASSGAERAGLRRLQLA